MPRIELINVSKRWGKFVGVDHLNMVIEDNEFITLLGPSGCGKTTTLRMIAGLETPTEGKIIIGDQVVFDSEEGINVSPAKRDIGFLFQNYALWPHMTVYKNIAFGLENVKQEMPLLAEEIIEIRATIAALSDVEGVIGAINKAADKETGKIDEKRAAENLLYKYHLLRASGKKIVGLDLHVSEEPQAIAEATIADLSAKQDEIIAKYAAKGLEINEQGQITAGGEVLTKVRHLSKTEIEIRVHEVMKLLKIEIFEDRYPAELSGGQQQRVAIARTLAPRPKVLFMDEPLSNLDAKLRGEMRTELKRLHSDTNSTFVYVTHDQLEAMTLATRICLIETGVLQQYDPPLTVYNRPANLFVADFVGNPTMNFLKATAARRDEKSVELELLGQKVVFTSENNIELSGEDVVVGIRPEFLPIKDGGEFKGSAYSTLPAGMETTVKVKVGETILSAVVFGSIDYAVDEAIEFDVSGKGIILFDAVTGKNVGLGSIEIAK